MNLHQPVTARTALAVVLVALYAVAIVVLVAAFRRESALAAPLKATEISIGQAASNAESAGPALRTSLAAAREKQTALEARLPKDLETDVFASVSQVAQRSGIGGLRYERKSEYPDTLKSGTYKVYRFVVAGRGSQEQVLSFLDGLYAGSGPTMIVENVSLTAASGNEWLVSADIIVYTLGA